MTTSTATTASITASIRRSSMAAASQAPMPGSLIDVSPTVIASEATTKNQPPDMDIIML